MSRKVSTVTITEKNRDQGKTFVITEMSAYDSEAWSARAFLAIAHAGILLPDGMEDAGMPDLIQVARILGHVQFPELKPLMDELLGCVQYMPDPKQPAYTRPITVGQGVNDDIEEVSTYQRLREEVATLHVNFTLAGSVLILIDKASSLQPISISAITSMSPGQSDQ